MALKLLPHRLQKELLKLGATAEAFGQRSSSYPQFDELAFELIDDLLVYMRKLNNASSFKGPRRFDLLIYRLRRCELMVYTVESTKSASYEAISEELVKLFTTLLVVTDFRKISDAGWADGVESRLEEKLLNLELLSLTAPFVASEASAVRKSVLTPTKRSFVSPELTFPLQSGGVGPLWIDHDSYMSLSHRHSRGTRLQRLSMALALDLSSPIVAP